MRLKLGIGGEERIVLPPREAQDLGLAEGDEVEVHTVKGAFTLAARPGGAGQPYFAGSLSSLTVAEVFHFVFTTLKSGVLLLSFGSEGDRRAAVPARSGAPRRISVFFRDGQVVFASSTDQADRLGAVLWRQGQVPRRELERCGRAVTADRPLGQVLVDEGILTSGQLYAAMALQVREIALGAFLEPEGEFAFVEGPYQEDNAVKLTGRTRDLLLEGMRRVEEIERISRAEVPDRAALVRRTGKAAKGLEPGEESLLAACDGKRTVRQAIEESRLGTYLGMKALARLVRQGLVDEMPPRAPPPSGEEVAFQVEASTLGPPPRRPGGPFDTYRRIFQYLCAELLRWRDDAVERLNTYFEKLPESQRSLFEGARVGEAGELDVAQVLLNVSQSGQYQGAAARARALEALEAFLAFGLFEVKNCLPRREAVVVLRRVGRMQVGKE